MVITDDNICKPQLLPNLSIVIALLEHEYDELALEYLGYYTEDINTDLLLYGLKNGNEPFLKGALKLSAFDKLIFREGEVIDEIVRLLK